MATPKEAELKVRVPSSMKMAIKRVADSRLTTESEIAREALLQYLQARGIDISSYATKGAQDPEKDILGPIVDTVKKHYPAPAPKKHAARPKAPK